jgi:hypothetical protein
MIRCSILWGDTLLRPAQPDPDRAVHDVDDDEEDDEEENEVDELADGHFTLR